MPGKIERCRDYGALREVWYASVRATHGFLSAEDLEYYYRRIARDYMPAVELYAIGDGAGGWRAFIGLDSGKVEMLFVRPDAMGAGLGSRLLEFAVGEKGARRVDVNEQNRPALAFYRKHGFLVVGRDAADGAGKPYPILHLEMGKEPPAVTAAAGFRLRLRPERLADYPSVEALVESAFRGVPHSDGREAQLVRSLRRSRSFVPGLSLVAESGGVAVGHVLFTRIGIGRGSGLALAPLAVAPAFRRRGVGSALIARGHELARAMGFPVSVVLGDPGYYRPRGYVPAGGLGILAPDSRMQPFYMAHVLGEAGAVPRGVVSYDPAFGI